MIKRERVSRPFDEYTSYCGYLYIPRSFTIFRGGGYRVFGILDDEGVRKEIG